MIKGSVSAGMKNLFEPATAEELMQRLATLRPDSERQWGKLNPPQMLAHCSAFMEVVGGEKFPPRSAIGRLVGPLVKRTLLNGKPIRRNMPTDPSFVIRGERNFDLEQKRLSGWIDRVSKAGPAGCTRHPHTFLGPLTPEEWAVLSYKHLDHHLRQFGV